jgi:glycosyltransferase involved in cell wall biosynthesis
MFGIVIPVYRGGKHLAELIESLTGGTDPNWEVVIVDDSNSNSIGLELLKVQPDVRFTIIRNSSNQGPFPSWNIGLQEMINRKKYSLISVIHEDDLLHENYIKNSFSYLTRYPNVDIFHSKVKLIGDSGKWIFSLQDAYKCVGHKALSVQPVWTSSDNGLARILRRNFIFCPTMIFNMKKFDNVMFAERWGMVGDLDFISKALLEGRTLLQIPDKNYFYRRHRNNLTAEMTRTTMRFEEEFHLYKVLEVTCNESGFYRSAKVAKKARIIKLHISYRILLALTRFDFVGIRRLALLLLRNMN